MILPARLAAILVSASAALAQTWTHLGPAPISGAGDTGRVSAIACHPTLADRYYAGGADGGVWRSDDAGVTWTSLTGDLPSSAIGAITLDPTDPDTIYVGTGEANFANHSRYGLGIYKSTDAGATWMHLAEDDFAGRCISRIVIDPANPARLYAGVTGAGGFPALAAAKGHPGAPGPVGVFRSDDSGASWMHLQVGIPERAATDLVMDPVNSQVLYAAIGHIFGDPTNGIYKTIDGGDSWTPLAGGLPSANVGRIALAIAPSNANRLYALIANACDAFGGGGGTLGSYRSDNAGATWTTIAAGSIQASYGWYLCVTSVRPTDPNTVIMGGLNLVRSTNSGTNFTNITPPHVDLHVITWDAAGRLVAGDDGGVHVSTNVGTNWTARNAGLGTIQFYAGLSTHPTDDLRVLGGLQDNGCVLRGADSLTWARVTGGDGGWTQWDQSNPLRMFTESQGSGNLYRSTNGGSSFGGSASGINSGDRHCFLPPYIIDPTNSSRMLYATHRVYQSLNGGTNWTAISPDLTGGAPAAIRALAISPADPQTVYVATNDGRVLVSTNGGSQYALVLDDAWGWPRVTREIYPDPVDPAGVYLAGATFGAPQVRRTRDRGQTWETLDGDLPDLPVNVITTDHRCTPPALFAGTDAGVYRSQDDGRTWHIFGAGMPRACVIDLRPEPWRNRLIAGTQGRGAWSIPMLASDCPPRCDPDVNCDGAVNGFDIEATEAAVNGDFTNFCQASADLNGDGAENGFDIEIEEQRVNGAPCP
ncbi:Xyloglucanase [Phycisphaerales bacterium]|nr:Xyloglucanase [Phycisphaerales bacterium]